MSEEYGATAEEWARYLMEVRLLRERMVEIPWSSWMSGRPFWSIHEPSVTIASQWEISDASEPPPSITTSTPNDGSMLWIKALAVDLAD